MSADVAPETAGVGAGVEVAWTKGPHGRMIQHDPTVAKQESQPVNVSWGRAQTPGFRLSTAADSGCSVALLLMGRSLPQVMLVSVGRGARARGVPRQRLCLNRTLRTNRPRCQRWLSFAFNGLLMSVGVRTALRTLY